MTLLEQRIKGQELAPYFLSKGWRRDKQNNTFHKGDKEAYFFNDYLVLCFGMKVIDRYCHKIKIK